MSFRAIQISKTDQGQKVDFVTLEDSVLTDGDVLIEVSHSSVNYKDGLAVTGKAPIIRKYPLIPGIDLAGTVRESTHPGWKAGDQVVGGMFDISNDRFDGTADTWMSYIAVDDVDAAVAQVAGAGGTVLQQPFDVPTVGRIAQVADGTGAVVGLATPAPETQA